MTGTLKINHHDQLLIMDKTFAKRASIVGSEEYRLLQEARQDYKTYAVTQRKIKKNPNKESYRGLTYAYMEEYISCHENAAQNFKIYAELRMQARCHSIRYPTIKKWFLNTYPDVAAFGVVMFVSESTNNDTDKVIDIKTAC